MDLIRNALKAGRTTLSEAESKKILSKYGIPVTREIETYDESGFINALKEIGFPMVIKSSSPEILHKTERGLIHMDIRNREEALSAYRKIMNETGSERTPVLVQELVKGGRELVAGLVDDIQFGPCVMFGLGGIFTEIFRDISFRVAPLEKWDALDMIDEVKSRKMLDTFRGFPKVDLEQLVEILLKLGRIGQSEPHIKEIDINPVLIAGSKPVAVDALIVVKGQT